MDYAFYRKFSGERKILDVERKVENLKEYVSTYCFDNAFVD